jgi:hypothetical protein
MIQKLDTIALAADLPEHGLLEGDLGSVVLVHGDGRGYEVEFVTLGGETVAVLSLHAEQVRSIAPREIAHARTVGDAPRAA